MKGPTRNQYPHAGVYAAPHYAHDTTKTSSTLLARGESMLLSEEECNSDVELEWLLADLEEQDLPLSWTELILSFCVYYIPFLLQSISCTTVNLLRSVFWGTILSLLMTTSCCGSNNNNSFHQQSHNNIMHDNSHTLSNRLMTATILPRWLSESGFGTVVLLLLGADDVASKQPAGVPPALVVLGVLTVLALVVHPDGLTWILIRKTRDGISTVLRSSSTLWSFLLNNYGSVISSFFAVATFCCLFFFVFVLHKTLSPRSKQCSNTRQMKATANPQLQPNAAEQHCSAEKKKKRRKHNHGRNHRNAGRAKEKEKEVETTTAEVETTNETALIEQHVAERPIENELCVRCERLEEPAVSSNARTLPALYEDQPIAEEPVLCSSAPCPEKVSDNVVEPHYSDRARVRACSISTIETANMSDDLSSCCGSSIVSDRSTQTSTPATSLSALSTEIIPMSHENDNACVSQDRSMPRHSEVTVPKMSCQTRQLSSRVPTSPISDRQTTQPSSSTETSTNRMRSTKGRNAGRPNQGRGKPQNRRFGKKPNGAATPNQESTILATTENPTNEIKPSPPRVDQNAHGRWSSLRQAPSRPQQGRRGSHPSTPKGRPQHASHSNANSPTEHSVVSTPSTPQVNEKSIVTPASPAAQSLFSCEIGASGWSDSPSSTCIQHGQLNGSTASFDSGSDLLYRDSPALCPKLESYPTLPPTTTPETTSFFDSLNSNLSSSWLQGPLPRVPNMPLRPPPGLGPLPANAMAPTSTYFVAPGPADAFLSSYRSLSLPPGHSPSFRPQETPLFPHVKENPFELDDDEIEAELQELGGKMVGCVLDY